MCFRGRNVATDLFPRLRGSDWSTGTSSPYGPSLLILMASGHIFPVSSFQLWDAFAGYSVLAVVVTITGVAIIKINIFNPFIQEWLAPVFLWLEVI